MHQLHKKREISDQQFLESYTETAGEMHKLGTYPPTVSLHSNHRSLGFCFPNVVNLKI